jgi:hypothetical protein
MKKRKINPKTKSKREIILKIRRLNEDAKLENEEKRKQEIACNGKVKRDGCVMKNDDLLSKWLKSQKQESSVKCKIL